VNTQATINQCVDLLKQEDSHAVKKLLTPIVKSEPENFHALQLLGVAHHLTGEPKAAITYLERALAVNPNFAPVQHNTAGIYRALGDMQKAETSYRAAIRLKPDYAEAYQGLAEIIKFKPEDPLFKIIHKQLAQKPDANIARYFHFALGKMYDDCADYDRAFKHFNLANQLSEYKWPIKQHEDYQKAIRETYSETFFQQRTTTGLDSKNPVFIVGLPRSGSTLVEQILSSHSKTFAAGEISDIQNIASQLKTLIKSKNDYPYCVKDMTEDACKGLGKAYLNRVMQIEGASPQASRCIDKNLSNFNHLGLISNLLPKAFIIHIQRHPLDCCISSYFQNFSRGVNWSFKFASIISYYKGYHAMMKHWQHVLPMKILNIRYEALVSDSELISKKIIDFCELPWEESCLEFHKHQRPVKTASVWQVRQPIYQHAKARWKRYENHIVPLQEGLADYINEYEKSE
jgi:tetratricopeptide (TPR) repeat protein